MKILCLGDSLTYGYGAAPGNSWVSLLRKKSSHEVINKGVNGDTTSSLLVRYDLELSAFNPDYMILLIGTNDLLMGTSAERVHDNICFLLKDAISKEIKPIVLCPPVVFTSEAGRKWSIFIDYDKVNTELSILGELLSEFCEEHSIDYINLYEIFKSYPEDFNELYIDGVHPDIKGHELIYRELCKLELFVP